MLCSLRVQFLLSMRNRAFIFLEVKCRRWALGSWHKGSVVCPIHYLNSKGPIETISMAEFGYKASAVIERIPPARSAGGKIARVAPLRGTPQQAKP